jgi:hypothetical protein
MENKITYKEFIQCLVDNKILIVIVNNPIASELKVSVDGQHLIRRGTTHIISSHVIYDNHFVNGARVTLTIEDFDDNIIRQFNGFIDVNGDLFFHGKHQIHLTI